MGPHGRLTNLGLLVRAAAADTDGRLTLIESAGQTPGDGPPMHVHANEDEAFYVIEGTYTWLRGEQRLEARPGDVIWLPRGVPHTFIVGPSGGRMLHLFVPGGIDECFIEQEAVLAAGGAESSGVEIGKRYGVTYLT